MPFASLSPQLRTKEEQEATAVADFCIGVFVVEDGVKELAQLLTRWVILLLLLLLFKIFSFKVIWEVSWLLLLLICNSISLRYCGCCCWGYFKICVVIVFVEVVVVASVKRSFDEYELLVILLLELLPLVLGWLCGFVIVMAAVDIAGLLLLLLLLLLVSLPLSTTVVLATNVCGVVKRICVKLEVQETVEVEALASLFSLSESSPNWELEADVALKAAAACNVAIATDVVAFAVEDDTVDDCMPLSTV